jgi:hypothetical protein
MVKKEKKNSREEQLSVKDILAFTLAAFYLLLPYIVLVACILGGILLLTKILA